MNKKLTRLAEHRQQLILQVAEQRTALTQNIAPLRKSIALADTGIAAVNYIKQHPILMVGGAALIALLRPTRLGKWLQRGFVVLEIARNLRGWLMKQ